jgi:hypothetical protein
MGKFSYSVHKAPSDFVLSGTNRPNHPYLLSPSNDIFLPTADYFAQRALFNSVAEGTLLDEAYILCGWLNSLHEIKRSWKDVSDRLILQYTQLLARRGANKARIQRSADLVFHFYWIIQNDLKLLNGVVNDPRHMTNDAVTTPVSAFISANGTVQGKFQFTTVPKGRRRPTPDSDQVESILDRLISRMNIERGQCYWLAASLMFQSGLRSEGVASVSLRVISAALAAEGIKTASGANFDLSVTLTDYEAQDLILARIQRLKKAGRTKLFILVVEKSRPVRDVGIPIELFEQILIYVWSERPASILGKNCDALFLSQKTGEALTRTSLAAEIDKAFKALDVRGSPHRLRAAFAEKVVHECYLRARAQHGSGWDRDSVLLEAAEALGHASTRHLRHYLNRIIREENLIKGEPVIVTVPQEMGVVKRLVKAINEGDEDVARKLRAIVEELIACDRVAA